MRHFNSIIAILCMAFCMMSCHSKNYKLKSSINGEAGEIVVVINKGDWESEPGIALRESLAADYPQLPQREPMFNLFNIQPSAFSNLFKTHRNLIIARVQPNAEETELVHNYDVWASPQTVVTITAPDKIKLSQFIKDKSSTLRNIFEQAERDRIITNTKRYEEHSLRRAVCNTFGGSPYFPAGYSLKKISKDFIWISYETTYINQGILIYRYPMTENTKLDLNSIIRKRNEVLKENVPGMFEGTYMTTTTLSQPELKWVRYKGNDFAEVRGLWEVYNDYMGGPFVSHSFYDRDGKNILVIEGFVYAPKYDKRNYLRQVESILYSFEWEK